MPPSPARPRVFWEDFYSHYSLPLSPKLFGGRILASEPKRGDVVVFRLPRDDTQDYIKRLIGLPGDKIQMINGLLHINGDPVKMTRIEDWVGPRMACDNISSREARIPRYLETLPGGVSHEILDCSKTRADNTDVFEVPAGHYFLMGDNRDNSIDSRYARYEGVGFVPAENLIGHAKILYFSLDEKASIYAPWRWPREIRWSRFLNMIR